MEQWRRGLWWRVLRDEAAELAVWTLILAALAVTLLWWGAY